MAHEQQSELPGFSEDYDNENTLTLVTSIGFEDDSKHTKTCTEAIFSQTKEINAEDLSE